MMNDEKNNNRLFELQLKWLNKTITEEEMLELDAWYISEENKHIHIPTEFAETESELEERILSNIKSSQQIPSVPIRNIGWFKWIAAASVLFVLGWGSYKYWTSDINPENKIVAIDDPKPGYDHAILKLGDGKTIILDSSFKGNIQKQGSSFVSGSEGELRYIAEKDSLFSKIVFNTMTTPRGGQFKLMLSDGTLVWLNSASEIRFPTSFTGSERLVELRGEAFFDVAKDASKPFFVKLEKTKIEVLGTEFNINAYSNELSVRTTLISGSVNIKSGNSAKIRLIPGQQARVFNQTPNKIEIIKDVDVEDELSWQKGIFQFRNADLNLIARQLSRWYDIDIQAEGNTDNIEFGGGISKNVSLSQILIILKKNGIMSKWNNKKLILYAL
jgi:transmembrane sensor